MIRSRLSWTRRWLSRRRWWPWVSATLEQLLVVLGVLAVHGQELDGGLELGAGQAGVGVRAFLLGRPAAVAVGQAGLDPVQVVLDRLRFGGG